MRLGSAFVALLVAGTVEAQEPAVRPAPAAADSIALWDGLGDHRHPITTRNPLAQRYFDQGLRFVYAFDHPDAIRSFRLAQRLDSTCALCAWGEALAFGPNINVAMDSASGAAAYGSPTSVRAATPRALRLLGRSWSPRSWRTR